MEGGVRLCVLGACVLACVYDERGMKVVCVCICACVHARCAVPLCVCNIQYVYDAGRGLCAMCGFVCASYEVRETERKVHACRQVVYSALT
jgi:hypothetical protein